MNILDYPTKKQPFKKYALVNLKKMGEPCYFPIKNNKFIRQINRYEDQ